LLVRQPIRVMSEEKTASRHNSTFYFTHRTHPKRWRGIGRGQHSFVSIRVDPVQDHLRLVKSHPSVNSLNPSGQADAIGSKDTMKTCETHHSVNPVL
jgi:hypothetical protein